MWVFGLPGPHVPTHVLQVQLRLEAELPLREGRGGVAARHVARAPVHDLIRYLFPRHSLERLDDLEHRHPLPSPQVVDLNTVEVGIHNLMKYDSLKPVKQNQQS